MRAAPTTAANVPRASRLVCLAGTLGIVVLAAAGAADAKTPSPKKPPVAAAPRRPPAGPLPFLPTVARVSVDGAGERLLVTEDVRLPRGEWTGGDLDLFIAFGAPAAPVAIDAHLYAPNGEVAAVPLARSARAPAYAHPLLGPRDMSGVVAHVPATAFRASTANGEAILRVRTVLAPIRPDGQGAREVLVRLGVSDGEPIAVERIELGGGLGPLSDASAHLCGADADPYPLAIAQPRLRIHYPRGSAPWLATRHPGDSLCIRWQR